MEVMLLHAPDQFLYTFSPRYWQLQPSGHPTCQDHDIQQIQFEQSLGIISNKHVSIFYVIHLGRWVVKGEALVNKTSEEGLKKDIAG